MCLTVKVLMITVRKKSKYTVCAIYLCALLTGYAQGKTSFALGIWLPISKFGDLPNAYPVILQSFS